MNANDFKLVVEALLMSASEPLSLEQLRGVFEEWQKPSTEQLRMTLSELASDYENRAIELKCLASGYCLQTKAKFSPWISRLHAEKPSKYSRAFLETLAIIAYRQPVTRADIEDIRGVAVSRGIVKTLVEREWVRVAGHRDVPGKPAVYVTTKTFLDYFNLASLNDLPTIDTNSDSAEKPAKECVV
jgi:segregation and condensation protein B